MQEASGKMQEASGKTQWNSRMRPSTRLDLLIAGVISVVGALARIPYLVLIPVFNDCVLQPTIALSIRPGGYMPLVGNDPYAGPLFLYILAVALRVFTSPITPHIVVMSMGALTVGLTYLLARALGLSRWWAVLAGVLMATNPLHILINSHIAGASYIVPLFSTAFLLALTLAVKRASGAWLVAAGALLGLAVQANPVAALMLPGVAVWFLAQPTGGHWLRKSAIGFRTCWPYLAVAALALVYAPVIWYNLQTGLVGVKEVEIRDYIWQPNPSLLAYVQNLGRLLLQLGRQVSGVLEGGESLRSLMGAPLLYCAWALAGLVYAARRGISLPLLAVGSQVLITPWLSNYYGMTIETRFTNQLTPLILVAMSLLAADAWSWTRARLHSPSTFKATRVVAGVLLVAVSLWPLVPLFRYYERETARGETNAPFFAFSDEFMRQWKGEKVFLSDSLGRFNPTEFFVAVNHVPYSLMPFGQIMERLATGQETGPIVLILENGDLPRARTQADLIAWDSPAFQTANKMGYGVYAIADARQVRKPDFVFSDTTLAPSVRPVQANLADQLALIGYEPKATQFAPGDSFVVNLYWKTIGAMPESYTGFLHLTGPEGRLVTQDDHELGRGFYRTLFWQPGEVVRERYELALPKDIPPGDYTLWAGVYGFPSLKRLAVRSADKPTQDNRVMLDTLYVGP
jgi:hypothetical protein